MVARRSASRRDIGELESNERLSSDIEATVAEVREWTHRRDVPTTCLG
jgi:hypothetical protein